MSNERMLVEAIAETLKVMKGEDPMEALLTAKEAKAMADDHNTYKRVLKAIAKLIHINASCGNYECKIDFDKLDPTFDSINKKRLAFLLEKEGYKIVFYSTFMGINWGK